MKNDEFNLFKGYTASFKDFMGGGATTDLLEFLGGDSTANTAQLSSIENTTIENAELLEQVEELESQIFDLETKNSQLEQKINELEFEPEASHETQQQIQELFEENMKLADENEKLKKLNGQPEHECSVTLQQISELLNCTEDAIIPTLEETMEEFHYHLQKIEKDGEEIEFFKTEAARVTEICRENIIIIRRQCEELTGWRLNIQDDFRTKIERVGNQNLWFQTDKGQIVGSSSVNIGQEPVHRILARHILNE